MAKKKQLTAEEVAKINAEKVQNSGLAHVDDDTSINFSADSSLSVDDTAVRKSGFILSLSRFLISLKNKISKVVLLFAVGSMLIICMCEFVHVRALTLLNTSKNALSIFFFFALLLSILSVVCYMNSSNKHSSKRKKYGMLGVFFVMMLVQVGFDIYYIIVSNEVNSTNANVIDSTNYTYLHLVFVAITIILAAIEPVLQPYFKRINVNKFFDKLYLKQQNKKLGK